MQKMWQRERVGLGPRCLAGPSTTNFGGAFSKRYDFFGLAESGRPLLTALISSTNALYLARTLSLHRDAPESVASHQSR